MVILTAILGLRRAPGRGAVRRSRKSDHRAPGRGRAIRGPTRRMHCLSRAITWTYQQAPVAPWSGAAVHAGPHCHSGQYIDRKPPDITGAPDVSGAPDGEPSPSLAHLAPGGRRDLAVHRPLRLRVRHRPPPPPPSRRSRCRPVVRPPCGTPRSGPTPREVGGRASPTPAPACARLRRRCCCDSRALRLCHHRRRLPRAPRGPCGMDLRKRGEGRVH